MSGGRDELRGNRIRSMVLEVGSGVLELGDELADPRRLTGLADDGEGSALAFDDAPAGDERAVAAAVHERDSAEIDHHLRMMAARRC